MSAPVYRCSVCERAVVVTQDGAIVRACVHADAKVIASVSATLYGISSLRNMTAEERRQRGI